MKKKCLSLCALFLALCALVFVYTDREEYTWRFWGESLAHILITQEEAAALEAAALEAAEQEKAIAAENIATGGVKKDQYNGAPKTLDAVDAARGLNLMWGDYEVTVQAVLPESADIRVVSAGLGSFIAGGAHTLAADTDVHRFAFTLTDSARQVVLACDLPGGAAVTGVTVRRASAGVFSRDLAAYALLAFLALSWLICLSYDRSADGPARRRDAMVVLMIALFASMPLLWNRLYDGHDLFFHLNRIEGVASSLRAGQFPVRIHASTLQGYGYAAPQFYPELFLYIPAALRCLGVSLCTSVCVFEMLINFATALVCYLCARSLFGSRRTALCASALYTLCLYRIANLYVRGTIGESLAMIFFPLLILALYEVLVRDQRRWPLLALAMTGIFMSHLLSTLFAVMMCVIAALLCAKRLLRAPARILSCVKAAALMLLCSLWFLVPMLSYGTAGINTSVEIDAAAHILQLGGYLVAFPGDAMQLADEITDFAYTIGTIPGLALMLGCAVMLIRLYAGGAKDEKDKLSLALLILSGALLLGATAFFPWEALCALPRPYSSFFKQIQYPWRLVSVAAPMMAMAGAWGFMREEKSRSQTLASVTALCMVLAGYTMQVFVQDAPLLKAESYCDTRIEQYEYAYENTQKYALVPGEIVPARAPQYAVYDYEKRGPSLRFTLDVPEGSAYTDLPLLYYPNYRATANGENLRVQKGDNNVLRIVGVPEGTGIEIAVWYQPPLAWLIAQGASLLGAAAMCLLLRRMAKKARA